MPPTVALPLQSSPAKAIGASFRLPPALNHTPQASSSPTVSAPETPPPRRTDISAFEIKRVVAAVMEQVDWAELAADVACNRRAGVYRRAVREVLGQWLEEAVEAKEEVGKEKQKGKG